MQQGSDKLSKTAAERYAAGAMPLWFEDAGQTFVRLVVGKSLVNAGSRISHTTFGNHPFFALGVLRVLCEFDKRISLVHPFFRGKGIVVIYVISCLLPLAFSCLLVNFVVATGCFYVSVWSFAVICINLPSVLTCSISTTVQIVTWTKTLVHKTVHT